MFRVGFTGLLLFGSVSAYAETVYYCPDPANEGAEVSATYYPGVDVQGQPVAPADLPENSILELPESFGFSLKITPQGYPALENTTIDFGEVYVDPHGRACIKNRE